MTVKVWPKNDLVRKKIRHPSGVAFGPDASVDPAEWPDDSFTFRRIRDGDVLTSAPVAAVALKAAEKKKFAGDEK